MNLCIQICHPPITPMSSRKSDAFGLVQLGYNCGLETFHLFCSFACYFHLVHKKLIVWCCVFEVCVKLAFSWLSLLCQMHVIHYACIHQHARTIMNHYHKHQKCPSSVSFYVNQQSHRYHSVYWSIIEKSHVIYGLTCFLFVRSF